MAMATAAMAEIPSTTSMVTLQIGMNGQETQPGTTRIICFCLYEPNENENDDNDEDVDAEMKNVEAEVNSLEIGADRSFYTAKMTTPTASTMSKSTSSWSSGKTAVSETVTNLELAKRMGLIVETYDPEPVKNLHGARKLGLISVKFEED